MAEQQQQQQQRQQSQQDQAKPQTTSEYYKQFANPNLFISNNANPFLISPYSPNQVNGPQAALALQTNTISPFTPSATIQVQGNMNVNGYSLSINNSPLFTDKITSLPGLGVGSEVRCTSNEVVLAAAGTDRFVVDSVGIGVLNTLINPGPVGPSAGYVPFSVNGTQYWVQVFS